MVAPMLARDNAIGADRRLALGPLRPFTDEDLSFFTSLARQATIAVENAPSTRMRSRRGAPPRRPTRPSPRSSPR